MDEKWVPVRGYDELYMVSNLGKVKSLDRIVPKWDGVRSVKGRLLAGNRWSGYPRVALSKNGVTRYYSVHRLVASAFIPNPENLPEINHKDESRDNNRADNLEWCDRKYNVNYGTCPERIGRHSGESRLGKPMPKGENSKKCIPVFCVTTGERFAGAICAARKYGLRGGNITNCCRGRAKTCGGKEWRYTD